MMQRIEVGGQRSGVGGQRHVYVAGGLTIDASYVRTSSIHFKCVSDSFHELLFPRENSFHDAFQIRFSLEGEVCAMK
jgi:hypothetical protein